MCSVIGCLKAGYLSEGLISLEQVWNQVLRLGHSSSEEGSAGGDLGTRRGDSPSEGRGSRRSQGGCRAPPRHLPSTGRA